ncbi:glycoside hydrolase family 38 N-terminal domain-containing protein [Paenibacillus aestuarii]|uniref:Glycosyl hydrolase-related protein n=1 Tax=Paenibacillus aestuarii TaxID=516965 RepID=A0ABW0K830_9BACL|nr:DUF5054 domain-containing protein [Paenibacillus aestuarii]
MTQTLEKIYVVFKTHFDIGFTGWVSDVVERYRTEMLQDVIDICDRTQDHAEHEKYVWTMSSWPLLQSLEGSSEADQLKAQELIQKRQLIWHKLPYTTHTEFCGLEEWIRGMYVSRALTEQYGYDPKDAKMTDVPGHTWSVPSLLKKAGVQILHMGCNPASTPPDVPPVFFWEGPDGERLLTLYAKGSYGTGILPPDDWEHPVWLAMIQTSDNHGPHDASIIEEMKASIAAKGLKAELHIGSLGDFAEDFLSRGPNLPVVRGDLADAWIHGVGTAPKQVSRVREMRGRLAAAESALSVDAILEGTEISREAKISIDKSYEHTLLFGEHTWGMDCKTFLFPREGYDKQSFLKEKRSERYQRMEHSWQEQIDYLNRAELELENAMAAIGGAVADEVAPGTTAMAEAAVAAVEADTSGAAVVERQSSGTRRVYNHLGWTRDAVIVIPSEDLPRHDEQWVDGVTGEPLELVPGETGARAMVKSLPALGFKTIVRVPKQAQAQVKPHADTVTGHMTEREVILENPHFVVKIDRSSGFVSSLWDKRLGKEWVDNSGAYGFGQYEYNIYSNQEITRYLKKYAYRFYDWGVHDFGKTGYPEQQQRLSYHTQLKDIRLVQEGSSVRVEVTAGSPAASVTEYGNAGAITWSLTMTDAPYLDMEWQLHSKEETPLAESGHILFPLKLDRPQYRINKLGSVIDPCTDLVPSSSTLLNCLEYFVDISNGSVGMAVIPLDTPLFFIGRNGMWDFEHAYKPEKPELNFNLFNNWWGTNFPQWTGGDLRYRFRLVPHQGEWQEAEVWRIAQETMNPAIAIQAAPAPLSEGAVDMLAHDLEGMAVISFKPAEDGEGYILRLREWTGEKRAVTVSFTDRVQAVKKTDLLERDVDGWDGQSLAFSQESGGKQVRFVSNGFEVHTLRVII